MIFVACWLFKARKGRFRKRVQVFHLEKSDYRVKKQMLPSFAQNTPARFLQDSALNT